MNEGAVNIIVCVFCGHIFFILVEIKVSKNRIAGSYDKHVFNIKINCQIVFVKWLYHFTFQKRFLKIYGSRFLKTFNDVYCIPAAYTT